MAKKINLPQAPIVIKKDDKKTIIQIDGCYPGYGTTLASALRRVLLSSLPGTTITAFHIRGVDHEFSTIPYVFEDVIHLGLNLKKIRFQNTINTEEPIQASLKVKGEKEATGADIKTPAGIQVVNKDAHIATLTNKKAELEMDLFISRGYGYEPSETRQKTKLPIGTIALDAIYTPIERVSFDVENMRIGERTDFNRIIMEISTDGSISPEEAFVEAAGILDEHFAFLKTLKDDKKKKPGKKTKKTAFGGKNKKTKKPTEDILEMPIEKLKLGAKIVSLLAKNKIKTVKKLIQKKENNLKKMEGMGDKSLKDIKKALKKYSLSLK